MKRIILISGKAEHGKTTTAELLKSILEEKGNRVVIMRYAYYLKDIAKRLFGWDGNKDEKGRAILQQLGTEIIRMKLRRPLFHPQRICEDIEICEDNWDYVLIDDARFPNEIYYPKSIFSDKVLTVRVTRLNEDGTIYQSSLTEEQKRHPSETALDNFTFDYCINTHSVEYTRECLERILITEGME